MNIINNKKIEDEEVFDSLAQVQVAVQASDSQLMLAVVSVPGAEIPLKQKIQSTIYLDFDFETQFINSMLSENYGSYQTYGYRAKITREVV